MTCRSGVDLSQDETWRIPVTISIFVSEARIPSSRAPRNAGTGGFSVPRAFFTPCCPAFLRGQTSLKSSPWHLLPAWGPLPHPGVPSLPGPHHPGDSAAQMESRAQRWAAGGTGDQGECVEAGDGAGMKRGTWAKYCSELQTPCAPC